MHVYTMRINFMHLHAHVLLNHIICLTSDQYKEEQWQTQTSTPYPQTRDTGLEREGDRTGIPKRVMQGLEWQTPGPCAAGREGGGVSWWPEAPGSRERVRTRTCEHSSQPVPSLNCTLAHAIIVMHTTGGREQLIQRKVTPSYTVTVPVIAKVYTAITTIVIQKQIGLLTPKCILHKDVPSPLQELEILTPNLLCNIYF